MLNLDTHILIHAVGGNLTPREKKALSGDDWAISDIVLWEIETLHSRRRIAYGLDYAPLTAALRCVTIWPITAEVCLKLRQLDFRSDPADEIIAATSLAHRIPIVTRDARIRSSKLLRFA